VEYLIQSGADVGTRNNKRQTSMHLAVQHEQHDIVEYLIKQAGADVLVCDKYGSMSLHVAAEEHDTRIMRLLLSTENINTTNNIGRTPLHFAVFNTCEDALDIVKILVHEYGASLQLKDRFGRTPVDLAEGDVKEYLMNL
jgi:ankyrin repeat protein